jgi:hypothetical protein
LDFLTKNGDRTVPRFDLSPEFRARRVPEREPDPAAEMVRAKRGRARRSARARTIFGAILLAAATPFFAFKAQQLSHAPATEAAPELAAKAPTAPPAALAQSQNPIAERVAKGGVDFTATSATCSASAREGEDGFCGPAKRGARTGAKDAAKPKAAKSPKSGKSAKSEKPAKRAGAAAGKIRKATESGKRG